MSRFWWLGRVASQTMKDLRGRKAILTGASGGIGVVLAKALAREALELQQRALPSSPGWANCSLDGDVPSVITDNLRLQCAGAGSNTIALTC